MISKVAQGEVSSVITYNVALTLLTNPLTVVRRKMQADRTFEYTSSIHCAQEIVQTEGPLGLYRGAPLSLLYNITNGFVASYTTRLISEFFDGETIANINYLTKWLFSSEENQQKLENK